MAGHVYIRHVVQVHQNSMPRVNMSSHPLLDSEPILVSCPCWLNRNQETLEPHPICYIHTSRIDSCPSSLAKYACTTSMVRNLYPCTCLCAGLLMEIAS